MKKPEGLANAAITLGCLTLSGWLVASGGTRAQNRTWTEQRTTATQVVLIYDHRQVIEGREYDIVKVNPKATVVLAILPLDRQAPLNSNDYMVCVPYNTTRGIRLMDGRELGPFDEIAFKCGDKRWIFSKMDIQ